MDITFRLNGETVTETVADPTVTLLDWLRETRGLTGTKEGCNEGDCGACSVVVTDARGARPLNACILFLPQLHGTAVRTVEGIAAPDGTLHPVQAAMVERHGSQCGFCTPGFVTTMACAHLNGRTDHADQIAGNLCRCTGYAPILEAARDCEGAAVPDQMRDAPPPAAPVPARPAGSDALAAWYAEHPDATLIAGATDVGLWVTKQFRALGPVAFLAGCDDLRGVTDTPEGLHVGAMTDMETLRHALAAPYPAFAELLRRYGSVQVRSAATLGGNIANGSPIGDSPPPLIALGGDAAPAPGRRAPVDAAGGLLPRLRAAGPAARASSSPASPCPATRRTNSTWPSCRSGSTRTSRPCASPRCCRCGTACCAARGSRRAAWPACPPAPRRWRRRWRDGPSPRPRCARRARGSRGTSRR